MFGITDFSFDFLTGQPYLTGLFFILFVLFAIYLYRRTNPPLSKMMRVILTTLRIIAVIALFLALFEPVLSYKREFERKPKLTLLIDKSGSMGIVENGLSRAARVDSILSSAKFNSFAEQFDVDEIYFAGGLYDNDDYDTDKTSLGKILKEVSDREIGEAAEAWLLFSDGISNDGISPAEIAPNLKTPVYSLGVGVETSDKDISISSLDYNDIVFAGKQTSITAHVGWQGMHGDPAKIEIRDGDRILTTQELTLDAGNLKDDVEVKFTPDKPGQQTFQISITGIGDEISLDNNHRSFSLTVLKSKMNVLLVSDRLDWEYAFLKRFMTGMESVELSEAVFNSAGGYLYGSFPARLEELNRYDLVILYDVNINALKSKKPIIDSYLNDKGGSIFVLMGENYLRASFPRWIDDYLPFINSRKKTGLQYYKFNGIPAENYLFHPAVRISDNRQGIRDAWQNLPNFEALVPTDSITPNSDILVMSDISSGNDNLPLIGFKNIGSGRVLASAAMPFWHWAFFGFGFGEDDSQYQLLMDGIIRWLSIKEDSDPIRITPSKNVYTRGESITFTASVFDLGFRPIEGAEGQIVLSKETGGDSLLAQLLPSGDGRYLAEFELVSPGNYKYAGVVNKDGRKLKETIGKIAVETFSVEEYHRRPDFELLSTISSQSGGSFYDIRECDSLFHVINPRQITVTTQTEISLWDKFWLLSIFILALGVEWLLRKRYQLV